MGFSFNVERLSFSETHCSNWQGKDAFRAKEARSKRAVDLLFSMSKICTLFKTLGMLLRQQRQVILRREILHLVPQTYAK